MVWAPTASPCLEQSACGTISPMMTMAKVAPTTATIPDVRVSKRIVRVLFTFSVTRLGDLLHSGQLLKAFGNN